MQPNFIAISVPTSGAGATAAATFLFGTRNYHPPSQGRSMGQDVVTNQNGTFKYVYDNGPDLNTWEPFDIILSTELETILGRTVDQQWSDLQFIWQYIGTKGLGAPEDSYGFTWAEGQRLERKFQQYPQDVGGAIETYVTLSIEEA